MYDYILLGIILLMLLVIATRQFLIAIFKFYSGQNKNTKEWIEVIGMTAGTITILIILVVLMEYFTQGKVF